MDVLVLGDFYTTDRGPGGAAVEHAAESVGATSARKLPADATLTARLAPE